MLRCCSRPTLATVIGLVHTIVCLALAIYSTINLVQLANENDDEQKIANSIILSLSLVAAVLSGVMIMGVRLKRFVFMAPYLWLNAIGIGIIVLIHIVLIGIIIWDGFRTVQTAIAAIMYILSMVLQFILIMGIHILSLYPIYTLYKEWRAEASTGHMAPRTQQIYATAPILNAYAPEKMPVVM